jgi:hypothetical protein
MHYLSNTVVSLLARGVAQSASVAGGYDVKRAQRLCVKQAPESSVRQSEHSCNFGRFMFYVTSFATANSPD